MSTYWPNPGTQGSQVQSMYDRLTTAAQSTPSGAEGTNANGQTNGVPASEG